VASVWKAILSCGLLSYLACSEGVGRSDGASVLEIVAADLALLVRLSGWQHMKSSVGGLTGVMRLHSWQQ
jgi:hypothetical protein